MDRQMAETSTPDPLSALERVIRTERDALTRIARFEGLGPEDALDCVHDAYCTFLQLALQEKLPPEASYGAYLGGIVRNGARNRRRRHHLAKPHDAIESFVADEESDGALELMAKAEEHIRLRACVDRLCETQKAVVTLRLLEDQPGEDVAQSLGLKRGYVDVLLHRAKGSLLACMTEDE
jgi:RNA polymerase sigma-70 factor (ECF subfamily)